MMLSVKQFVRLFKDTLLVFKSVSLKEIPMLLVRGTKNSYKNLCNNLFFTNKKMQNLQRTNLDLGIYHFYKGNLGDAHFRFKLLQMFTSKMKEVIHYNIGRCYVVEKKYKKANRHLMQALHWKKNYPEAHYSLAKINDQSKIEQVPISIIQERFNYMSSYYTEEYIVSQQYKTHKIIFNEITGYFHNRSNIINILDVGSGTGACAHFLKMNHIGNSIVGVDISNKMVDIAKDCYAHDNAVYDKLFNMSIEKYFADYDSKGQFDLILSIDSSCYYASLSELFLKYKGALKVGGIVLCLCRVASGNDFQFMPDLDLFQYSQDYMLKLSLDVEMEAIKVIKCPLYNNIDGLLCMFKRVG